MSSDFDPVPEERGNLQPPRRRPPTAVGTMTPPPPGHPVRGSHRVSRGRSALVITAFTSPLLLGALSWYLIQETSVRWLHALGAVSAVGATLIGAVLV